MTEKKFYKTTITLEVLSEQEIGSCINLEYLSREIESGDFSGSVVGFESEKIDGKETANKLISHGSDPEFFMIDADGEDVY